MDKLAQKLDSVSLDPAVHVIAEEEITPPAHVIAEDEIAEDEPDAIIVTSPEENSDDDEMPPLISVLPVPKEEEETPPIPPTLRESVLESLCETSHLTPFSDTFERWTPSDPAYKTAQSLVCDFVGVRTPATHVMEVVFPALSQKTDGANSVFTMHACAAYLASNPGGCAILVTREWRSPALASAIQTLVFMQYTDGVARSNRGIETTYVGEEGGQAHTVEVADFVYYVRYAFSHNRARLVVCADATHVPLDVGSAFVIVDASVRAGAELGFDAVDRTPTSPPHVVVLSNAEGEARANKYANRKITRAVLTEKEAEGDGM